MEDLRRGILATFKVSGVWYKVGGYLLTKNHTSVELRVWSDMGMIAKAPKVETPKTTQKSKKATKGAKA